VEGGVTPILQLPAGVALTDIWAHLSHPVRRRWLAVVTAEARAVRAETRAAQAPVVPWEPEGLAAVVEAERSAIVRRRTVLLAETEQGRRGPRRRKASLSAK